MECGKGGMGTQWNASLQKKRLMRSTPFGHHQPLALTCLPEYKKGGGHIPTQPFGRNR